MTLRYQSVSLVVSLLLMCGVGDLAYGQDQNDKAPQMQAVASVNGKRTITKQEIDELIGSQFFNLEERIHNLRKNALETVITRVLIEEEAQSKGITVQELRKQLLPSKVEIKDAQVEDLYESNIGGLGNMSEDEAKQRIRLDLEGHERMEQYK